MYIKELYIGAFGGIKDRGFSFTDGINLIEGENESGKSTLCAFIKFIFFGLPARAKATMSDRKRYLPFDGSPAFGTLTLVTEEGEYIIARTFTPSGRGGSDKVQITDTSTAEAVDADPAEHFLGMTETLFTRTAYLTQLSGGRIDGTEVSTAMENLLYSKDEEIDSAAAIKALEKAATALVHKRGNGGKLNEAMAELDLLSAKAAVNGNAEEELSRLEEQINSLSKTEAENERILREAEENVDKYRRAEILRSFDELDKAKARLLKDKEEYSAALPGGHVPSSEDLMEMVRLSEGIKNADNDIALRGTRPLPDMPVGRIATDGGKEKVKADLSAKKSKGNTFIACAMIFFTVTAVLFVLTALIPLTPFVYLGAGAAWIVGVILLTIGVTSTSKVQAKLKEYGIRSLSELESLSQREDNQRLSYEKEVAERRSQLAEAQARKQEQVARASLLLERYGSAYVDPDRLAGEVARLSALREKLAAQKANIDLNERDAAKAQRDLSEHDRDALKLSLAADPYGVLASIDIKENERRATFGATSRDTLREKLSELRLQRVSLAREADEANAVKERMVALNDEIGLLRDRYNAVSLALSALESAAADVKEQFSPALASRAAEIMAQATEGRYDRFILGREMNISYMDNAHGGAVRDADHLSAGTKDMAYISLRIALCEVLCEKGELPMIFDESFASMDEGRLAAILSVIAGRKGQSFILSSGKREGICLNGCNKIKM